MTIHKFYQHLDLFCSEKEEADLILLYVNYSKRDEAIREFEYYFYCFHSVMLSPSELATLYDCVRDALCSLEN